MPQSFLRSLSENWKSGLTVALVSIPLSLSLAIASGAAPVTGIITAVWAGFTAALLGGSKFNVVGPAGALSGILAAFVLLHGAAMLPLLAMCTGALVFVVYLFRWDKYLVFIPSSVMYGFTMGVGLTIGLNQLNAALGLSGLPVHASLLMNVGESLRNAGSLNPAVFALFVATLAVLYLCMKFFPRIPGAIVAAVLGMGIGYASSTHLIGLQLPTILSKFGGLQATIVQVPSLSLAGIDLDFAKTVFTVAVVAVLETLLSAKIVDTMTGARFDQKKEVFGLAVANVVSGLAGGLPATGVLVRSSINVRSGATSNVSSAINAVFVALIAMLLFGGFQYLPMAVVAGILVFAAIRMVEVENFRRLYRFDRRSFWLAVLVGALTFAVDPMIGILAGSTIALLGFAKYLSLGHSELTLHKGKSVLARVPHHKLAEYSGEMDSIVYRFAGELTYFNGKSHMDAIRGLKADTVIFSLRNLFYVDFDGVDVLGEIVGECRKQGKKIMVTGVSDLVRPALKEAEWFADMQREGAVYPSTTDALAALGFPLGEQR